MKKLAEAPLKIALDELPSEGRSYAYSNESAKEFSLALADIIGQHPYQVNFHVLPIGNAFEISGQMTAIFDLLCSRCGQEMQYKLNEKFREILLVDDPSPQGSRPQHQINSSSKSDDEPFCNFLPSSTFYVDEYIHEVMASNEPQQPFCQRPDCAEVAATFNADEQRVTEPNKSPFAALKGLKIGNKTSKH